MPYPNQQMLPYFLYAGMDHSLISNLRHQLSGSVPEVKLVSVNNGFDVIQFLEAVEVNDPYPELIILTHKMKRLNGKETIELLRTDNIFKLIPIIIFLADNDSTAESYFLSMGADVIPVTEENYVLKMTDALCNWLS